MIYHELYQVLKFHQLNQDSTSRGNSFWNFIERFYSRFWMSVILQRYRFLLLSPVVLHSFGKDIVYKKCNICYKILRRDSVKFSLCTNRYLNNSWTELEFIRYATVLSLPKTYNYLYFVLKTKFHRYYVYWYYYTWIFISCIFNTIMKLYIFLWIDWLYNTRCNTTYFVADCLRISKSKDHFSTV